MTNDTKIKLLTLVHLALTLGMMTLVALAVQAPGWPRVGFFVAATVAGIAAFNVRDLIVLFEISSISEGVSEGIAEKVEELS